MSFFKTCAVLALATSLAIAKPVQAPHRRGTALSRREDFGLGAFGGNDNGNDNGNDRGDDRGDDRGNDDAFDFIGGFNDVNDQERVIQIQEQNLQIIDNGRQQAVIAQAKEVLIVDQERNGFNNDMNDIFRKTNARRENEDETVVMLVVQEIQIAIDDGEGNVFQQQVFAQSAVVANRGRDSTKTVMMFAAQTLVAQDILGDNNDNGDRQGGRNANDSVAAPTKTNDVQLLGAKPTWSEVAEDPAATVGDIWAQEVADAKNVDNNAADNQANADAAAAEKAALDEQAKAEEEAKKQEEQAQAEQAKQQEEQAKQQEEQAKQQEEQAKQQEEQAKQQEEQAKQQEEAKAQEEAANATAAKYI